MPQGISRLTIAIIQSNDDADITCDASGPHPNGKWAGCITFWKNKRPHISPLISTEPIYETKEEAVAAMEKLRQELIDFREPEAEIAV